MHTDKAARALSKARRRGRGLLWHMWIRVWGGSAGRRLEVDSRARMRWAPHRGINIGDDVYIGIGAVIDAPAGCRLVIGDGVKLMHYSVRAASREIRLGRDTQVADQCSVRDSDHGTERALPMKHQLESTPVVVGHDVWIGRGVAVLKGSVIGDGAVIGANSVVRGDVPAFAIAVGAPVRIMRQRR